MDKEKIENKQYLTVKDVAKLLKLNINTVYYLTYHRQIPFVSIGRTKRFDKDKIMSWIELNSHDIIPETSVNAHLRRCK
jgi:excisionase family DNA binding protein